ncbi:serine hydrolase-domain-containing protein [Rhypophila decipiens]|uniref:Serine hydrolase-domain-containing protein n=1 Tax=Rhypophila decipiens TaxID=261697 RepID=A0AAN6Y974_9PEZI|nr:serine hydrolase-domain-containing protein [Rhypophila decipiens]
MILRPLHSHAAARSILRINRPHALLSLSKSANQLSYFTTSTAVRIMDDSLPSSGISTPVSVPASGTSTPLRGQQANKGNNSKAKNAKTAAAKKNMKEVRILMLHGYTQSGPLFRAKTRALEKLMAKALAPLNLVPNMIYPTAPNRLRPSDIPGFGTSKEHLESQDGQIFMDADKEEEAIDSWAWFRKDEMNTDGRYRFLGEGMQSLAGAMKQDAAETGTDGVEGTEGKEAEAGEGEKEDKVIDGVIGFSQGGAMAALLASAMEKTERAVPKEHEEWVKLVREANKGVPLKFAVSYSGFFATPQDLAWLYEPKIKTPTLHFLGSLDVVVEEARVRGLVERCEDPHVVVHPGGHYVPVSKEWVMQLVGFVKSCMEKEMKKD